MRTFRVSEAEGAAILLEQTKPKALKEKVQFNLLAKFFIDKRFNGKIIIIIIIFVVCRE